VAQDELGPVLLVPGYGGSTAALEVLAAALEDEGRRTRIIRSPGDPRGDLRDHAETLAAAAQRAVDEGAPSVDVVGYSAGGVVVRYWIAELGGGSLARRAVTLASPHHGTDLAGVAAGLAPHACPEACRQLAPDSDLLRQLNADDETPAGPRWVAIWTTDDETVVPASSGSLEGALDFSVQSVCPGLTVRHGDVPRTPAVIAMVAAELGVDEPALPGPAVCG
jgi:triacylglycerol esterase/lipase EstA (alpha/beta hydrolase family)